MRHVIKPPWVYYKHTVHYTTERNNSRENCSTENTDSAMLEPYLTPW